MRRLGISKAVLRIAGTHFVADAYSNIYTPLLPVLIPRHGLTLAAAGTLMMLLQLGASISQLGFGHLADRWRPRVLLVGGPFLTVLILGLIGLAPTRTMLGLVLVVGGLGGAAFHPTAAAMVHRLGGKRSGLAMSVHITAGSLGFATAPLVFAPFAERFGPEWIPVLGIPGIACLFFLLRDLPIVPLGHEQDRGGFSALRPYATPLTSLYLIVVLRTLVSLSFATFVPILLVQRGASLASAGAAVSAYLYASALGGMTGGPAADRFGHRRVIALSMACAVPFLVAAPLLSGWAFVVALAVAGFFLQSTLPVNVTFAHVIAPVSAGTVSSLMLGVAWGTGGLAMPLVGMLADTVGIQTTLLVMALVPLLGLAATIPLPGGRLSSGHTELGVEDAG